MQIKNTTKRDETIRGVEFKAGETVTVNDADLARKVLGIEGFKAAPKKVKKNDTDKG